MFMEWHTLALGSRINPPINFLPPIWSRVAVLAGLARWSQRPSPQHCFLTSPWGPWGVPKADETYCIISPQCSGSTPRAPTPTFWSDARTTSTCSFQYGGAAVISKLPLDVWAPYPISKGEPSNIMEETHFSHDLILLVAILTLTVNQKLTTPALLLTLHQSSKDP